MIDKVKRDSLGLLYENLANADSLAAYWATQSQCSPQYRPKSAPYIGPQIPRTSQLRLATHVIIMRLQLKQGLSTHYMPYMNPPDTIMQMQEKLRPAKDMPAMQAYFQGII